MEVDPTRGTPAFQDMMKKITMPAMYMRERGGQIGDTFKKFEQVAGRSGADTGWDYVEIIDKPSGGLGYPALERFVAGGGKSPGTYRAGYRNVTGPCSSGCTVARQSPNRKASR